MRLVSLELKNFKGIKSFVLKPDGKDVTIYGDNGAGKTTLADAWHWLLFGKNSLNQADFEIKPLDTEGKPLSGVETEVEALIEIDGKQITLKKVYSELWTKRRGSPMATFTGHTTHHFVNDVPTPKGEYDAYLANIINEDAFKLLTSPRHFNEVLTWQQRRVLLLEVCGDVTDADVIASDVILAELPAILGDRKLDDHKKVIKDRKTAINKELTLLPARVAEVQRGLPDAVVVNRESLELARQERSAKQQKLAELKAGGQITDKNMELLQVKAAITEAKNSLSREINKEQTNIRVLEVEVGRLEREIAKWQSEKETNQRLLPDFRQMLEHREQKYQILDCISPDIEPLNECPTCGQMLTKELAEILTAQERAGRSYERELKLASLADEIEQLKGVIECRTNEITDNEQRIQEKLSEMQGYIKASQETISALQQQEKAVEADELTQQKETLEQEIATLEGESQAKVDALQQEIEGLNKAIASYEREIALEEQRQAGLARVEELEQEQRKLSAEYEKLEKELYLCEAFTRAKVSLLESNINAKFASTKFKLFDEQVNGAIADCCETTFEGVPYSDLNHGGRMGVGLDIITTLQRHFGQECPVIVDNAESYCHLPDMNCQIIQLVVSVGAPLHGW